MAVEMSLLRLPERVGRYSIEGLYSQGGMSNLLLGRDPVSQKRAIIKVLLPQFSSDQELVDRFINEGRILSLSRHQNVVQLYEFGYFEKGPYIAMEFIFGTPLSTILRLMQLPLEDGLRILCDICAGVRHLHGHGIVHGDLKPENILIDCNNEVKIIDFGIAKVTETGCEETAAGHHFLGSPFYMAPEVQHDYRKITVQSDIYSLGILGYELLSGRLSRGKIETRLLPKELSEIIDRALQKSPADRYASVDEFVGDLSSYRRLHDNRPEESGFEYYFDKYGQLQKKYLSLLESLLPTKSERLAASYYHSVNGEGLYFRCLEEDGEQMVVMAKSVRSRSEGVSDVVSLHTAFEEGSFRIAHSPEDVSAVFAQLRASGIDFGYSCFKINAWERSLHWIAQGYGTLFTIREEKAFPTGLLNQTFQLTYKNGDRFLIAGCPMTSESNVALIVDTLELCSQESLPKIALCIKEEIRALGPCFVETQPVCVVAVSPLR